ncbi:MAG: hypothetical protein ACFFB3_04840, partial [Candidatus Hodarchaeota archaeon]
MSINHLKALKTRKFVIGIYFLLFLFPFVMESAASLGSAATSEFRHHWTQSPDIDAPLQDHMPTLSNPSLSPSSGTTSTQFSFEITYTDLDDEAPWYVIVFIDSVSHQMRSILGSNYTAGVRYRYQTLLSVGTHSYYFQASDGTSTVWDPLGSTYTGPEVNPPSFAPILSAGSVSPPAGYQTDVFVFTVSCSDADNKSP